MRKRLLLTRHSRTPDWTEADLVKVLTSLKNNKARDPLGWVNELFKPPVAGRDMVQSLIIMNSIKRSMEIPEVFRYKNVTAVYKNKGPKNDLKGMSNQLEQENYWRTGEIKDREVE